MANLHSLTNAQVARYHREAYPHPNPNPHPNPHPHPHPHPNPHPNPNPDQVARYHREAYRPDNMLFILSGTVDEADFLAALEQARKSG